MMRSAPRRRLSIPGGAHLKKLFSALEGNARVIVVTEGIANVFFSGCSTYLPLYMLALGVTTVQVGLLTALTTAGKILSTFMGGYLADRFGRKRMLVVIDIICWGIPMLLFTIARNPWYFLFGWAIMGFVYLVLPSFECLFVEDVPLDRRQAVFGAMQFLMAAGSLLTPVAGLIVAQWGIVGGGRVLMGSTMVVIIAMACLRQFALRETSMGQQRMLDTVGMPLRQVLRDYVRSIRLMAQDRRVRLLLGVRLLAASATAIWMTYAMIYLADKAAIGLPESLISAVPFVSAIATILLLLLASDRMRADHALANLIVGQVLAILASTLFVLSPGGTFWFAALWAVLNALGVGLFRPALRSSWANIVPDKERAQIFSVASTLESLCILPLGPVAGLLYTRSPRAPFCLGLAIQLITLGLVIGAQRLGRATTAQTTNG